LPEIARALGDGDVVPASTKVNDPFAHFRSEFRPLDTLSELSEEQQMRMQQVMDRKAKATETLSNVMKKLADTSSTIAGNLK
jgi:hypothetical protein